MSYQGVPTDKRCKNCRATRLTRTLSEAEWQPSRQNNWCVVVDERTARHMDKNHGPSGQREKITRFQDDCVVSNDEPHPQVRDAFGLTTRKPVPVKPPLKSRVASRRYGTLSASIKKCIPSRSTTASPSFFSSRVISSCRPEQPPFATWTRKPFCVFSSRAGSRLWSCRTALSVTLIIPQ